MLKEFSESGNLHSWQLILFVGTKLSVRSLELINLQNEEIREVYVEERKEIPFVVKNFIVCISTINKSNTYDPTAGQQLVIGTESGYIYVLDVNFSKAESCFILPYTPVRIRAWGNIDNDYSLNVLTRNDLIYTISKAGMILIDPISSHSKIIDFLRYESIIVVATLDNYFDGYNLNVNYFSLTNQGIKTFSIRMPSEITILEPFVQIVNKSIYSVRIWKFI